MSDPADIRYQTLAERAEAANELASMLSVQLRDVMRERDALRAWADRAPYISGVGMIRVTDIEPIRVWLTQRPEPERPQPEAAGGE